MRAQNQTQNTSKPNERDASILRLGIEWETVAMMTGERDGETVVIRWRKHAPVGRLQGTHAIDVRTCGGRCTVFDRRAMTEAQAAYQFDRKIREFSQYGFAGAQATVPAAINQ